MVTGANSGPGPELPIRLAGHGAHVVLTCRNERRGAEALAQMPGSAELILLEAAAHREPVTSRLARSALPAPYHRCVGHYRFSAAAKAPREQVFDLWTNLDRAREWIEGLTRVTDVTGPTDKAGTRYTTWFGRLRGGNEILEAERPRLLKTRLVSGVLRGTTQVTFDEEGDGTRVNLEFWTDGIVPAIAARIFATGSYKGSFRGELEHFVRIADREASRDH